MGAHAARSIDQILGMFEGPVNSIPTSFGPDGTLDADGIRAVIDTGIEGGSRVTLLTYGDSQFDFLTDTDVAELTRLVVGHVRGRALVVAAGKRWWTGRELEFARYCLELGADLYMLLPGQQMSGPDMASYYKAVAKVIPVMVVGAPAWSLLDQLADEPRICCFKEDGTESYAVQTLHHYGERWRMMTGGSLWRHFTQWPFGCRAFMSWPSSCAPRAAAAYWKGLLESDLPGVSRIVSRFEAPLFAADPLIPGGWQTIWRALLEISGVAKRFLRPPAHSATDAEVETIRGIWKGALATIAV